MFVYQVYFLIHILKSTYILAGARPKSKSVVFRTALIWVQPQLGRVVASLDKTLYDDYLHLVALNKQ